LRWSLAEPGDHPILRLCWRESDGPPVIEPERQGFGSRMIVSALRGSDGAATFTYRPTGLEVDLELRL
jgi:two-component sensor histidine kinase